MTIEYKQFLKMFTFMLFATVFGYLCFVEGYNKLSELPGHLQRLGAKKPNLEADVVDGFPDQKYFFDNYVYKSKPLIMRGAVKDTFAKNHWTDEYFLSLPIPADETVNVDVEVTKKQDRKKSSVSQHFHDFVKQYNSTDMYMVDSLPTFLGKDIILPKPLHCEEIYKDKVVDALLWYSSGNTRSVLHTDSIENINCLYHGEKEFVLIDPEKYFDQVEIDFPMGSYSSVDVDSVDYEKYPGFAEVEFLVANVSAGDCFYLPCKWFHYVRSFSRNLAVSVWWENHDVYASDLSKCSGQYDPTLTVDKIEYQYTKNELNIPNIKDFFKTLTRKGPISLKTYTEKVLDEMPDLKYDKRYVKHFKKITDTVDQNSDGIISRAEIDSLLIKDWLKIIEYVEIGFEKQEDKNKKETESLENPEDKSAPTREEL